jgi:O-antigen/teichoic acid export membrane protein
MTSAASSTSATPPGPGSTARAVAHGTTRLLAGLLSAKVLDFALYLVLARRLGVDEFGRYVFAFSFTLLFSIVADLGVNTVFTREVSRTPARARALLGVALPLKAALGAAALLAGLGIAIWSHHPLPTVLLIALFLLGLTANSCAALFEGMLKAQGRAGQAGLTVLAQSITALTLGAILVFGTHAGALAGAGAYLAAGLVHLVAAARLSRDQWSRPSEDAPAEPVLGPLAMLRASAPIALSGVFIALYFRVDSVMLHAMRGERDTGLYGGIYRFFEAFVLLSAAYRSVLFPIMARAADGPADQLRVLCRKSIRLHLLFTLAVATFFTFEAKPIVLLVLGAPYAAAAPALAMLMWALPGAYVADTLFHLLAAQGRQAQGTRAASATAVFNVVLNLALIPHFSFVGAAFATAASEALCCILLFAMVRARVPGIGVLRAAGRPLAGAAALAATLALLNAALPRSIEPFALLAVTAMIGTLIWAATLIFTGDRGEELRILIEALPGARRNP